MLKKYLVPKLSKNEPQGVIKNQDFSSLFNLSCQDDSLVACATYLPPKYSQIIIQNQYKETIEMKLCHIEPVKQTKHPKKNTKKIQEQKLFNKDQSIFKDWRDGQDVVRK